nr:unnamed protein product [Digitaria exilis]
MRGSASDGTGAAGVAGGGHRAGHDPPSIARAQRGGAQQRGVGGSVPVGGGWPVAKWQPQAAARGGEK